MDHQASFVVGMIFGAVVTPVIWAVARCMVAEDLDEFKDVEDFDLHGGPDE